MKRKNWLYLVLIALCLLTFFVYRTMTRIRADTEAPKITVDSQPLQVSVQDDQAALLQGVTARDNRDGDVTASLLVENVRLLNTDGTVTVTYAAFDKAGNVAKAERQVQYTDYESPKFTLSRPLLFLQGSNFDILSVIGAEDAVDGDIQHRIRATSLDETSVSTLGNHSIQFRVTNSLGDTVEQVFPVEVYAAGAYSASLSLTQYLVYLPVGANFQADSYLKSFTLNQKTSSLQGVLPANFSVQTTGTVNTAVPGVYAVSYTVTYTPDSQGNAQREYSGYSKLIVVVEG